MENNKNGCLYGIVILGLFYLVLFIFASFMDNLESILSKPLITFGIPLLVLLVINYLNKRDEKEDKNNKN